MANASRGKRGRFTKGDGTLRRQVFVRLTDAQHDAYLAAGGADWLRYAIEAWRVSQQLAPTPTAHNPFPSADKPDPAALILKAGEEIGKIWMGARP